MELGGHLSTGFATLEEDNEKLAGGGGHVYWGFDDAQGCIYTVETCSHDI